MDQYKQKEITAATEINVRSNSHDLYLLWRDLRNFPDIFAFLDSVTLIDNRHYIWSTTLVSQHELIVYHIEITEDIPDKAIYWHSEETTDILHYGSVVFVKLNESTTQLRLNLKFFFPPLYDLPGFPDGSFQNQIEEDLRRFQSALNAKEFPRPNFAQEDLPDNLPHQNLPTQNFQAEQKKGDSHKRYNPPPKE